MLPVDKNICREIVFSYRDYLFHIKWVITHWYNPPLLDCYSKMKNLNNWVFFTFISFSLQYTVMIDSFSLHLFSYMLPGISGCNWSIKASKEAFFLYHWKSNINTVIEMVVIMILHFFNKRTMIFPMKPIHVAFLHLLNCITNKLLYFLTKIFLTNVKSYFKKFLFFKGNINLTVSSTNLWQTSDSSATILEIFSTYL